MIKISKGDKFDSPEIYKNYQQGNPFCKESQNSKYLWVIDKEGCKIIKENTPFHQSTKLGIPCHTNLTGGGNCYFAGEVWFLDENTVRVNTVSMYYEPLTEYEYKKAIEFWEMIGYKVIAVPLGER